MIINGIKSDDYIYVRILEENNYIPFYISHLKKGTVIRFNIIILILIDILKTFLKIGVILKNILFYKLLIILFLILMILKFLV